ncbi:ParB/RepB/Spo0J family partition protein [Haliovirga abyssi]|uniref:Chromosome partitioning protein ParB n=1 Tax=Haliovirga abyssi TaxID=2996794 RepID=A0AAU9DPF7_9FUSO|nr:ParB/RepB/Spo0J family partition protein [Haliovirga abyssi]BDU50308.1 chromosome partitioning protein ParB [Haliovirga abyssi]
MESSKSSKTRLGKGLNALIKSDKNDSEKNSSNYILEIEIDKVKPNPLQPRKKFDESKIIELASSIKENGILQPIIVREKGDIYEIIAGERRYRASLYLKLEKISVIVKNAAEDESLELAIIENIQREDLNPIEEGEAYQSLIVKYGYTQEVLANKLGKKRSTITNTLRLLKLSTKIKQDIIVGKISSGHARALLSLKDEDEQEKLSNKITKEKLSVRETEKLIKLKKVVKNEKVKHREKSIETIEVEKKLTEYLGAKVRIKKMKDKKGQIVIEYYSNGDLERLLETICITK